MDNRLFINGNTWVKLSNVNVVVHPVFRSIRSLQSHGMLNSDISWKDHGTQWNLNRGLFAIKNSSFHGLPVWFSPQGMVPSGNHLAVGIRFSGWSMRKNVMEIPMDFSPKSCGFTSHVWWDLYWFDAAIGFEKSLKFINDLNSKILNEPTIRIDF